MAEFGCLLGFFKLKKLDNPTKMRVKIKQTAY